ncbi:MAG: MerR family transcriptional regulator [Acidimicrobiia bacterium]
MSTSQGTFDEAREGGGSADRQSTSPSLRGRPDEVGDGLGWSGPNVCDIVGITYRQLDYWDSTDLLKPSLAPAAGSGTHRRYSYRDLVQLKVIKGLLDAGVRLQTARKVIESLRSERGGDWQTASLVIDGTNTVLARDGEHLFDLVRTGQGVFNVVPVGNMVQELDAAIHRLALPGSAGHATATEPEQRAADGG